MTISEADAAPFLAAISHSLDDPLPKLIFADWLDEQGDGPGADAMRWAADRCIDPIMSYHPNLTCWWAASTRGLTKTLLDKINRNPDGRYRSPFYHHTADAWLSLIEAVRACAAAGIDWRI